MTPNPSSPLDREMAEFVASDEPARRFPINAVKVIDGELVIAEEISVFLVRDPVLIELLTFTISKHQATPHGN